MSLDGGTALAIWEQAAGLSPLDRAILMAAHFCAADFAAVAGWPIDERDRRLIEVLRMARGPVAFVVAVCPGCGERVEAQVDLEALLATEAREPEIVDNGTRLPLRPPSSRDVAEAVRTGGAGALAVACAGTSAVSATAVATALDAARPLLDVRLALGCECTSRFELPFDVGAYLWFEVRGRASNRRWSRRSSRRRSQTKRC